MESRQDMSDMGSEHSLAMIPFDQGDLGQNSDDVMARRLKNRERQRRYRARKRLQADTKKTDNSNNSAPPQKQVQVSFSLNGAANRSLCKRNWKQDARSAHVAKQQQIIANDPLVKCENNLGNSVNVDDTERKTVPSRRHWKTEARNKKD